MTYSLLQDDNKYIGPLATISGYDDLIGYVKKSRAGRYPNLATMLEKGFTTKPDLVAHEAAEAAPYSPSRSVTETLRNLYKMLRGKTGKVYIGDV